MSLNGLDDPKVKEAHEAAVAEPGGWFLLQYASRDEIEILASGTGGPVEIRNVISKQEEPAPLYGFLRYRIKNVIIKYLPEDSSRLVQARAAVHFNAICDYFAHNTVFEISKAKDLKDSKLSAACSLHAASASSSSSNSSLRRRRLNEIAEEEEEEEREKKRQSIVKEETRPTSSIYSDSPATPASPETDAVLDREQITNPRETTFASTKNIPNFTGADVPVSPTKSEFSRRLSSQSERPGMSSSSSYTYKPKVKLGPRPSLDANKRPATASNFRPVAALPAGFKFFSKSGSRRGSKPHEQDTAGRLSDEQQQIPGLAPPSDLVIPEGSQETLPPRPATSSGASVISMAPSMTPSVATMREGKISPEKARLMKAMKMREKKLQSAKNLAAATSSTSEKSPAADEEPANKPQLTSDLTNSATSNPEPIAELQSPITVKTEDTASDSHPPSPGASSIGMGESTKASSLSESTDETIQPSKEPDHDIAEEIQDASEELAAEEETMKDETTVVDPVVPTHTSESESKNSDVSDAGDTNIGKESPNIPVNGSVAAQTIEPPTTDGPVIPEKANGTNELTPDIVPSALHTQSTSEPIATQTASESKAQPEAEAAAAAIIAEQPKSSTIGSKSQVLEDKPIACGDLTKQSEAQLPDVPLITKRKVDIKPLRTDLFTKDNKRLSEYIDPLDDEALMDELQTATVQEAKPILVSKSPITPVFPNSRSPPRSNANAPRSISNPMRTTLLSPADVSQGSARSVSSAGAAYLNTITRQNSGAGLQKKNNVGSSISQRIKALEALSGSAGEENRPRPTTPSATFFTVRKNSTREPSKSPSVVDRADSLTRQSPTPERSRQTSREASSKGRERSDSVASRLTMFEGSNAPRGRPESVQVTARIIRDSNSPFSKKEDTTKNTSDAPNAEFRQSTLLVDVHRAQQAHRQIVNDSPAADQPSQKSKSAVEEKENKRRSSLGFVRDFIKEKTTMSNKSSDSLAAVSSGAGSLKSPTRPPSVRNSSSNLARRLSTSSRRSSFNRERDNVSGSGRISDSASGDDDKSVSDKKMNRTSRFMRRLSNSFGGNRKNLGGFSPTVREEDVDPIEKAPAPGPQVTSPTIVAFMGDVNVQFPDNLLWKRRSMCLDAQGFLFLSTVQGAAGKEKAGTKRFHLSDFRKPYIPDVEVQELPNSVVLDFVEGSCLQIACGDRVGQQNVLKILQEAHQGHAALKAHQDHTALRH